MNNFKVGFARRNITPPIGTRLYGYPGARKSEKLHDDLFVNVFAFVSDEKKALFISADLCSIPGERDIKMRKLIESETSIPYNNIILCAIHTHSGPSLAGEAGASEKSWGSANVEFIENIFYPQTLLCVKEALENLTLAEMGIGETQSFVGINRREIDENGKVLLGQNPDGPLDTKMRVLAFRTLDKKPIANIIHYGCHPTSAGQAPEISRDWPGYMVDRLEKETNTPSVYVNGAEGDVGPRLSNGLTTGNMKLTEEIGIIAGEDAVKAFNTISSYIIPDLNVKSGLLKLPYRPLPSVEETKKAMEAMGDPEKLIEVDITTYNRYKKILAHYESNLPMEKEWVHEQTYIALGPVVFVPYPFEIFCEISMNCQKKSPFEHTFCTANSNGASGYLPTKDQIPLGGYEIDSFCAFNLFILEENAAEQIVDAHIKLMNELFK